ncbi:hypothetical protein ACHAW6_007360 [Cyclotella cf. meneghiniana]
MEILHKCSGYKFFTKLDISMKYFTFKLDEHSQDLCTIITPDGKYKYLRLQMGLKHSLDIAQSIMDTVLAGIDNADVYILMMLVLSPVTGTTMSNYLAPYYSVCEKMQ